MKHLKQILNVVLLVLILSLSTYGGDIQMPGLTPPPPPPAIENNVGTGKDSNAPKEDTKIPDLTEIALNLLMGAVSFF